MQKTMAMHNFKYYKYLMAGSNEPKSANALRGLEKNA